MRLCSMAGGALCLELHLLPPTYQVLLYLCARRIVITVLKRQSDGALDDSCSLL